MSAPGRWLRLDVTWEESAWLDALPGESAGCWPRVLCVVKRDGVMGRCKSPSTEVLARKWRVSERAITALLDAAVQDGALSVEGGEWVVTNWATYQEADRTRNERQRRYREHNAVTPRDTGVTRRATETLTLTETNSTPTPAGGGSKRKPRVKPEYTPDFLRLWHIHGRGPKPEAFEAYRRAISANGVTTDTMAEALTRYVSEKVRPDFQGVHLFRWIQGERWEEHTNGNGNGHHEGRRVLR